MKKKNQVGNTGKMRLDAAYYSSKLRDQEKLAEIKKKEQESSRRVPAVTAEKENIIPTREQNLVATFKEHFRLQNALLESQETEKVVVKEKEDTPKRRKLTPEERSRRSIEAANIELARIRYEKFLQEEEEKKEKKACSKIRQMQPVSKPDISRFVNVCKREDDAIRGIRTLRMYMSQQDVTEAMQKQIEKAIDELNDFLKQQDGER